MRKGIKRALFIGLVIVPITAAAIVLGVCIASLAWATDEIGGV